MIAILDYGVGNSGSIHNMIRRIGGQSIITSNEDVVASASGYILPGVGAFDHGMSKLKSSGILDVLEYRVMKENTPILGICLGMQMLFNNSEEGDLPGLGWINGSVKKFKFTNDVDQKKLKVPHMGWNLVKPRMHQSLFKELEQEARFYFVHSYYVSCNRAEDILGTTKYGSEFVSSVARGNIFGVQFHPEKSHRFGMMLFENFLEISKCYAQE
jgi:imidazole glycerol-phosphate synthase subunit HisH